VIVVLFILAYAVSAVGLGRAAARRGWRAHAITAWTCAAVLTAVAALIAANGINLPGWIIAVGIAVEVLLITVTIDVHRTGQRGAAR
jgi:hypothetical protein